MILRPNVGEVGEVGRFPETGRDTGQNGALPTYSPELNPVESCWKEMKGGDLSNFTAEDTAALTAATVESARKISGNVKLIRAFFDHAGLPI